MVLFINNINDQFISCDQSHQDGGELHVCQIIMTKKTLSEVKI